MQEKFKMYFRVLFVVVVASFLNEANARGHKIIPRREPVIPDVSYYDCTGRHDTHEIHPWDCTRFIHCDNGRAHDKSCAACHQDDVTCPEGWLQFRYEIQECDWADLAGCETSGNQTETDAPTTTTTTTEEPEEETTTATESPGNTTTSGPDPTPNPGDDRCPVNCEFRPVPCECGVYFQCHEGTYHEYRCPEGLHFNHETGVCDHPENAKCDLDPKDCCECKYFGTGSCSADYIFQDHDRSVDEYEGSHHCTRTRHSCAEGLVWNERIGAEGSCDFRENVAGCNEK